MELSVVIPTLNDRERLGRCLDALAERAPDVETIVVNGPSVDGTTGMVRDRPDVDVLVEVDDRGPNVARNAGIDRARGEVVAFLAPALVVEEGWSDAIRSTLGGEGPAAATGPAHRSLRAGVTAESVETGGVAGRVVTYVDGGNAAFTREALEAIDGFDEYLAVGGARDAAHRLAGMEREVAWVSGMGVRRDVAADGGDDGTPAPLGLHDADRTPGERFRALGYRIGKNYGPRPASLGHLARRATREGATRLRDVAGGDVALSGWVSDGRAALGGVAVGLKDGLVARLRDRDPARNPNGLSARGDRAVTVYDWR